MIETVFTFCCDKCMEPFRSEDSYEFDLALESHANVRKLAKAAGWKRIDSNDICPECQTEISQMTPKQRVKAKFPEAIVDFYETRRGDNLPCWFIRPTIQGSAISPICSSPAMAWKAAAYELEPKGGAA